MRFFDVAAEKLLILQVTSGGVLIPHLDVPTGENTKMSYFCKRQPVKITEENFRDILIPGDMSPKPIDEFAVLVEKVKMRKQNKKLKMIS